MSEKVTAIAIDPIDKMAMYELQLFADVHCNEPITGAVVVTSGDFAVGGQNIAAHSYKLKKV